MRGAFMGVLLLLLLAACGRGEAGVAPAARMSRATSADGVATGWSEEARFVRVLGGYDGPESVRYDPELDVYFISNQTGPGSARDDNGFIVRVSASDHDSSVVLVQGGRGGVELHSPKGLLLHGDTLWAADIDKLRAFHRRTGAPLATVDFAPLGAVQLNDLALGPDGVIRVTDTGIEMTAKGVKHPGPDRIFALGAGGAITTLARGDALQMPNGITWDPVAARWIVVGFSPYDGQVAEHSADFRTRRVLWRSALGNFDGVEVLRNGAILYASWQDSSIHLLSGATDRRLIRQVPEPADIGLDTRRNILLVPLATLGQVQLWELGMVGRR
jgi:sugar lactone lactonase YvrE